MMKKQEKTYIDILNIQKKSETMTVTTKFWIKVIAYGLTKVHPAIKKMEAYENK